MPLEAQTAAYQEALARICRSGEIEAIPGVTSQKAQVYRDLIRGGVEDALSRAFPLTKILLNHREKTWEELVDDFLRSESLDKNELWRMPKLLIQFVRKIGLADRLSLPFLVELLEFEWIEIELFMMPDQVAKSHKSAGEFMEDALVINPELVLKKFEYPVFKVPPLELTASTKGEYFLASFRHPATFQVRFIELSALLFEFTDNLARKPSSALEFLRNKQEFSPTDGKSSTCEQLCNFVRSCRKEGLILGFVDGEK